MKHREIEVHTPAGAILIKACSDETGGQIDVQYCGEQGLSRKQYALATRYCDREGFTDEAVNACS
jgi:hypothetical protein